MFSSQARFEVVPLHDGHEAIVVDDALADPQAWVDVAVRCRAMFKPAASAYPGIECALDERGHSELGAFFAARIRSRLNARRTLHTAARLSIATQAPGALQPCQWFCHRDSLGLPPDQCVIACVLYLFRDESLGGTSLYKPRRGVGETERLVADANALDSTAFAARYPEIAPGYMLDSNDWFERVARIPARFNRIVFYDGGLFHSGDLHHPERLSADPATGRLTLNGFFTCSRRAS